MKVVVIGGGGHIGSFLIPKLVKAQHDVVVITRGKSQPYYQDWTWQKVEHVILDRQKDPQFNEKIAALAADVVIDLICFTLDEVKGLVQALKKTQLSHYLYCSSIWAHGRAESLPADPNGQKFPLDEYGSQKYASEKYLKQEYRTNQFPATVIMPGQISGPGWSMINPLGNLDDQVFQDIAAGKEIYLPNFGMETLHHVHGEDVAQLFVAAMNHRNQALGESFHAVAEDSLTLYGYAQAVYRFFGNEPKINFLSWEKWCEKVQEEEHIDKTYYHIARSGYYSIENAQRLVNYRPKYTTLEVIEASLQSYIERQIITSP